MRKEFERLSSILKASSDDLRITIIELLDKEGPKSYSELMKSLALNPIQDAGRFAYHLKMLTKSGLVDMNKRLKKYKITDLGKLCANFINELRGQTLKSKPMVRTSRLKIEEFNKGRIIADLIREANVPISIAKRVAREIEGEVISRTPAYLTGPLIREIIDSYLVKDSKLEEYRYRFTRLGLPIYEVAELLRSASPALTFDRITRLAGDSIIKEYALLEILDRRSADAHMSGRIFIDQIRSWFKPEVVWHDLRIFLRGGLPSLTRYSSPTPKPKSFEAALALVGNLINISATEVSKEEVIDHFNVFLAPFALKMDPKDIKRALSIFLYNLSRSSGDAIRVNIGLDSLIPKYIGRAEAVGSGRKRPGVYDEYEDEAREILSCLVELMFRDPLNRPVFAPSITIRFNSGTFDDKSLIKAHKLALMCGTPNFAYLEDEETSFTSSGLMTAANWKGDWEVDTMRMGNVGTVSINLPGMAYESHGNWSALIERLEDSIEIAIRALKVKTNVIKDVIKNRALPILSLWHKGDSYFRVKNSTRLIELTGLDEATAIYTGQHTYESTDSLDFAVQIVKQVVDLTKARSRKPDTRVTVAKTRNRLGARRFAEFNVENYGRAESFVRGTRRRPYYTSSETVPYDVDIPWQERLSIESKISKLIPNGHVVFVPLAEGERVLAHLISTSKEICDSGIRFFTYTRGLSHCGICQKTIKGMKPKCPFCGSATLVYYPPKHLTEF